jgi:hypothetical protein
MTAQPSYRPIYATFWDDPDQQELSDRACRVLLTLKGTLPPSGIGHFYESVLAQRCGCSVDDLATALDELERPKPGRSLGWIVRENQVAWVVNGLKFEPTIKSTNANHRKFIADSLTPFGGLTSPMSIIRSFRAYYPEWFANTSNHSPDGIGEGHGGKASTKGIGRSPTQPRTLPNQSQPSARARAREGGGGDQSGSGATAAVDDLARARYLTRCVIALNSGMQSNPGRGADVHGGFGIEPGRLGDLVRRRHRCRHGGSRDRTRVCNVPADAGGPTDQRPPLLRRPRT